jgi:hypothetical protein
MSQRSGFNAGKYKGKDLSENQPCMFCGEPADSREDIIPSWINRQSFVPQGTARPVSHTSHGVKVKRVVSSVIGLLEDQGSVPEV